MKKLNLFALITALAVVAPYAQAQTVNAGATAIDAGATAITINGFIPEYLTFTNVDNQLELGDLGSPTGTGYQKSFGTAATPHSGSGLVNLTGVSPGNGIARIEFDSNTVIRVETSGSVLRSSGADGIPGNADDKFLRVAYARSVFGPQVFRGAVTTAVPNTAAQQNTDINVYGTELSGATVASQTANYSRLVFYPSSSNGFTWAARANRNGLSDAPGVYSGKINMTYYKF